MKGTVTVMNQNNAITEEETPYYKSKTDADFDEVDEINYYLRDLRRTTLLTPEEEIELSKRIQKGSKAAKERLINSNLRLVVKIAKHYLNTRFSLMDLIQEGNIGLIKAAEKFDHAKGCRFSTYASWWIRHSILRSLAKKGRAVRIPYRKEDSVKYIEQARRSLANRYNRQPTMEEISKELNCAVKEIEDILNISQPTVSLNAPLNDTDFHLENTISASHSMEPDTIVIDKSLHTTLQEILKSLMNVEEMILRYRFGLYNGTNYTLLKTSSLFGVSAETIRQIEMKALNKLRIRNKHLKAYIMN